MAIDVFVPLEARDLFAEGDRDLFRPVFYTGRSSSRWSRLKARAGVQKEVTVARRLVVNASSSESLNNVRAIWLADWVSLGESQAEELLDAFPDLQWVFRQRASVYKFPLDPFRKRKVPLSNSGDLVSQLVAEFMLACVTAYSKRLPEHVLARRKGGSSLNGIAFEDIKLAVLGTGRIGAELARLCRGLGMTTVGISRNPERFESSMPYSRVVSLTSGLEEVLPEVNVLAVTIPVNAETANTISLREMLLMPRGSALISISHVEAVRIGDLKEALSSGHLGAAYLDKDPKIREPIPNLFLTHNSAANDSHKLRRAYEKFKAGVIALTQDAPIVDRVV